MPFGSEPAVSGAPFYSEARTPGLATRPTPALLAEHVRLHRPGEDPERWLFPDSRDATLPARGYGVAVLARRPRSGREGPPPARPSALLRLGPKIGLCSVADPVTVKSVRHPLRKMHARNRFAGEIGCVNDDQIATVADRVVNVGEVPAGQLVGRLQR